MILFKHIFSIFRTDGRTGGRADGRTDGWMVAKDVKCLHGLAQGLQLLQHHASQHKTYLHVILERSKVYVSFDNTACVYMCMCFVCVCVCVCVCACCVLSVLLCSTRDVTTLGTSNASLNLNTATASTQNSAHHRESDTNLPVTPHVRACELSRWSDCFCTTRTLFKNLSPRQFNSRGHQDRIEVTSAEDLIDSCWLSLSSFSFCYINKAAQTEIWKLALRALADVRWKAEKKNKSSIRLRPS